MKAVWIAATVFSLLLVGDAEARNPLIPGVGMADPHVHVWTDRTTGNLKAYMYATHDYDRANTGFKMTDWWVWSSDNLVDWKKEEVISPEETCLRRPFDECWATDAAFNGTHHFFYASLGPDEVGVIVSEGPTGPWLDVLGKPLLPKGLVDTDIRDPGVFVDEITGESYIVFGTFNYFIAKLRDDMVSLAESPKAIEINHPQGPYGNSTDDKPFLHKVLGKYYLSWGCFYATSDSPYGPFEYRGNILGSGAEISAPFLSNHTYMDRHGSFFEMHGQWYFICNDYSHAPATSFFRDTIISYVHYRENGDIAPLRVNSLGVGEYDMDAGIEVEDFFRLDGKGSVKEMKQAAAEFALCNIADGTTVTFSNVHNLANSVIVRALTWDSLVEIELSAGGSDDSLTSTCTLINGAGRFTETRCALPSNDSGSSTLVLHVLKGGESSNGNTVCLDSLESARNAPVWI